MRADNETDMSRDLLSALHDHKNATAGALYRIDAVADTLDEVGMEKMADRLASDTHLIRQTLKRLYDAYGADLDNRVREAQTNTGVILMALLDRATKETEDAR